MLLSDKVCVVTGASRGIGRAIVEQFAQDGAIVYFTARKAGSMDEWAKKCSKKFNTKVKPLYFDVTNNADSKNKILEVYKNEGKIDVLVNNAGVVFNKRIGMILREETELMFRVNVIAVLELMQLTSRLMARKGGGVIINISSITATVGSPGQVAYSGTKGAIVSITKSAAKELAPLGIRVNAIAPGIIQTERFTELYNESAQKINERIDRIALKRLGSAEDVAYACAFLASDRASYISGEILGVDGCATI